MDVHRILVIAQKHDVILGIMKKLPDRDTTILGYLSIITALGMLAVANSAGDLAFFIPFIAVGNGMLGVALLADRNCSGFIDRNPWLMRLINAPMSIAPLCYLWMRYSESEFNATAMLFGVLPVLIFIPLFKMYHRDNVVEIPSDADRER